MAHRIRSLETMTLNEVDAIFFRGRGLGLNAQCDSRDEDFTLDVEQVGPQGRRMSSDACVAPAIVIDDDLELVR